MSNLKCPFCQQKMIEHPFVSNTGVAAYSCGNKECLIHDKYIITPIMEMLDRTRKALDVAKDALKYLYDTNDDYVPGFAVPCGVKGYAKQKIDEITALEQKD